jgi:hypothetical protein
MLIDIIELIDIIGAITEAIELTEGIELTEAIELTEGIGEPAELRSAPARRLRSGPEHKHHQRVAQRLRSGALH